MKVRAVTFDVWETLIHDTIQNGKSRSQLRANRMAEVLRRYGHPVDPSLAHRLYDQAHGVLQRQIWPTHSDVGTREQLGIFLSALDPCLAASAGEDLLADLDDAYTSPFFDLPPTLAPGAEWALSQVQQRGLRVGLVCNTGITPGRDIRKFLDGHGVLSYFQELVFSDEERVRKPEPEIFQRILSRLGVSSSEAVHVGDDAISDIAGAKAAGMKAIMVRLSLPERLPVPPDLQIDDLYGVPQAIESL